MRKLLRSGGHAIVAGCLFSLLGCGGGVEDPFPDRTPVSGTMSLDGKPVQWGSLKLTGQKNAETQEQAIEMVFVRDGKFATADGAAGTTPGANEAEVVIYGEEPKEGVDNPKITGMWRGPVTVEADKPIALEIKSSELKKSFAK